MQHLTDNNICHPTTHCKYHLFNFCFHIMFLHRHKITGHLIQYHGCLTENPNIVSNHYLTLRVSLYNFKTWKFQITLNGVRYIKIYNIFFISHGKFLFLFFIIINFHNYFIQAMNLMIDKPHTTSNVDQIGDGIWNHGYVMFSVIPLLWNFICIILTSFFFFLFYLYRSIYQ